MRSKVKLLRWAPESIAALIVLAMIGASTPNPLAPQDSAQDRLTEDQRAIHVLNRLGFGPRPGDIDRVIEMGLEAYIEWQLYPEGIESPRLAEKLQGYEIPLDSWDAMVELDRPAVAMAERRRQSVQMRAERRGASPLGTDVTSAGRMQDQVRNPSLPPGVTRVERRYEDFGYLATLFWRATYSEAQLEEILVDFWFNHFNITSGEPYIHADYGENVIRRHALGRFEDLLVATARHPGMLVYLDNWLSTAPQEVVEARIASREPPDGENRVLWRRHNAEYLERAAGLNENYGRELMELHTLGVDGGYTQADVQEVAKAFTGWTLTGLREGEGGSFHFNPLLHAEGDKIVMGEVIPSGGMDEGMRILRMLARHPSTAHFLSTKLVRRFVADDPPADIVEAAAERFLETDGDIREVLRTIFLHPAFFSPEYYGAKVKKPFEVVVSGLRAVDADFDTAFLGPNFQRISGQMGELIRRHETPDGYPDVASAWVSTNALFKRLTFAMDIASETLPGLEVDLDGARELFRRVGFPSPTPAMVRDARTFFEAMTGDGADSGGMMGGMMTSEPTAAMVRGEVEVDRSAIDYESLEAKVVEVAFVLGSPDFGNR